MLYHLRKICATELATLQLSPSFRHIQWINVAIDVAQGPGTDASAATRALNMRETEYLAKLLKGLERGSSKELGLESRLQDVGDA